MKLQFPSFRTRKGFPILAALAMAVFAIAPPSARAATQYGAGTFTWDDATTAGWSATSGGPYTSTWTAGNDAILEGTAGTVSIPVAGATVHNLALNTSGYTVQSNPLTLNGAAPAINLDSGISGTIKSVIAGPGLGLTKTGAGTLTLTSAAVNTFTGGLTLNGGTLTEDYTTLGSTANLIDSTNTLALGGGILIIKGKGAGTTCAQTLGNVTVNAGGGQILGNNNSSTSTTITLGNITATAAGGSLITGYASGTTGVTITTTNGTLANGIYGGRHVWFNGTANTGYDWTTTASAGPTYTLSGLGSGSYTTLPTTTTTGTVNYNYTSASALTIGQSDAINSLKLAPTAAGQSVVLGGNLLTINSGGLLCTGANAVSITGDSATTTTKLTAGNGSGTYDLIVHQYNTGGLTISGVIGNNGSNPVALVKNGSSTLTLTAPAGAPNTYSGGTFVNAGTLALGAGSATNNPLGSGNVTVQSGATLSANLANLVFANNLTLNGGTLTIGFNGGLPNWSGPVTLTANSTLNGVGSGSALSPRGNISGNIGGAGGLTKTGTDASMFTGTNNTYGGPTFVKQGLLMVQFSLYGNDSSKWTPANITVANGATLGLNVGGTVSGNNEFTATQAAALFGNLTTVNNNGLLAGSSICISTANASGGVTYSANITDSTGTGGGAVGFKKIGTNTLELTGANTYTGQTIFDAGTLKVSSFNSVNGGSPPLANSSLGRPTTIANGTIEIGKSSFGGGNIVYTGTGETTDRIIYVAGQTATLVLDQSGSGLLKFTSPFTWQTGNAKTLTLQGATAGTGELSAVLADPSLTVKTTVNKSGAGTWTLSNANTYTGVTTVTGGALVLTNATALPGGIGTTGGLSALTLNGGVIGLGAGDFTRSLAAAGTVTGVNFTGNGGFAAYGADRAVNLGGASATVTWATAGTGLNAKTLILGNATATKTVDFQNPLDMGNAARAVQVDKGASNPAIVDAKLTGNITGIAGGNLSKTGTGTLALTGTNNYAGTTTVSAGTLLVNGTNSGTGLITVASTATLGGTGTIGGAATFSSGAKAVFTVTRDSSSGANTTPLTIAGVMTYNATEVHINAPANLPSGTYTLATSSATPTGTVVATPVLDSGSYAAGFSSAVVSLDTTGKLLILTVNGLPTTPTTLAFTSVNGGTSPTAGMSFSVVVKAVDANGLVRNVNADTGVFLSLAAGSPALAGNLGGIITAGTNSVTISGVLYYSAESGVVLTATASGGDSLTAANSAAFTVIPDTTPTSLTVTDFPTTQTAGVAGNVTVTARTSGGAVATSYVGMVHFTSNDSQAVLPSDYTFVPGDNGIHTFTGGVTLKTAGTAKSITATDTVTSSITGTESGITVVPAAASTLTLSGFPSPQATGVAASVTVSLKDAYDNPATNYTGTLHFTSTDGSATLPGDYTFVNGDQGTHTFTNEVTLVTLGTGLSITATDTLTPAVTGTQSGITVWVPPTSFTWANALGGNWSVAANWAPYQGISTAPVTAGEADYTLNFGAGTYAATNNLSNGFLVNQLNFSGAVTLGGAHAVTLTGTSPTINQNSASAVTVVTPLTLAADTTVGGTGTGGIDLHSAISGPANLIVACPGGLTLSGVNSYGTTTVNSNRSVQLGSSSATFGAGAITVNSGATLALNGNGSIPNTFLLDTAKLTNGNSFSANLSGPITLTGITSIDLATTGNMTITGIIDGTGGLNKLGTSGGPLNLDAANSYQGATTINAGIIKLGAAGSINNSSDIAIAAGASFDVSAKTSPYVWSANTSVTAKGTGTIVGTNAARILTASSGVVSLGSRPINLTFAPTGTSGDVLHPALLVTPGALTLNNNTFTVTNTGSALGAGVYRLIQVGDGSAGVTNENASPAYAVTVNGNGLVAQCTAKVSVSSGNVIMTVLSDPYEPWIATYFPTPNDPNAAKDADPDGDGQNNLEEFAFNSNPTVGAASGKIRTQVVTIGTDQVLVITLPVRGTSSSPSFTGAVEKSATGDHVKYTITGSAGLATWGGRSVFR